jgi:hypothetical protein
MPAWTNNHGREYRYYTCSKKVKTGYKKCSLPSLPAEAWVAFSSRRPHEQMRIIADIIDNDVLRAAPSLFPTQSEGFGSYSQYSEIEYKGVRISDDSIAKSIGIDFVELRKLLFSSPFEKYP